MTYETRKILLKSQFDRASLEVRQGETLIGIL